MKNNASARLHVGITIGLHSPDETLWNNGIKQNAVFLAEALQHCPNVAGITLVNTTAIPVTDALPWDRTRWPTLSFGEAKDRLDVLIELGGQIGPQQTAYLKNRGCYLISYCCGFEYVHVMEGLLFSKRMWDGNLFVNGRYDDIWMIPQVANISRPYFEVFRRKEAKTVPFVWSPLFLEEKVRKMPHQGLWQPPKKEQGWRLSVMEPNINVVKFCLYPILAAELAYRRNPEAVRLLQVCNTHPLAQESRDFIALMNQLDIVKNGKAVFLGRHDTPVFLAENTDAVISHQWENPLNYFYLEVLWQGYPLIHNAGMIADLGYFYSENDLDHAASLLQKAFYEHGKNNEGCLQETRAKIGRFLPGHEAVTATYTSLLNRLLQQPLR